jgi:hypothetical protein
MGYYTVFLSGTVDFCQYNSETVEALTKPNSVTFIKAPIWQQAFKFILTKLDLEIDYNSKYELNFDGEFNLYKLTWIDYEGYSSELDTAGNENCLKELIKIIKNKL